MREMHVVYHLLKESRGLAEEPAPKDGIDK
jgi:hypothetical protein